VHAITTGLLESEYFAAVAVHAGALPADSYDLIDYHDRKTPFAIWVGNPRPLFPCAAGRSTKAAIVARGLPVTLEVMKHHTHAYYGKCRDINRAAWAFLKEQRLSVGPNSSNIGNLFPRLAPPGLSET
jgi:hypothetical protein